MKMATKSKRASTATPQPQISGTSTPLATGNAGGGSASGAGGGGGGGAGGGGSSSSGSQRPTSPLSPTRYSRLAEKAELQSLNDRLACYIERVRNLETENSRLNIEVESNRDIVTREVTNIKAIYDSELSDARRLLDDTAREKAKLEIDIKRLWEENEELKNKYEKKSKECSIAEANARMYETRVSDLSAQYTSANNERKKAMEDLRDLQKEIERLQRQLDEARKNLEEETLTRVDLENNIQSLREELAFKDQIHIQEINETRSRRQIDITEIDGRLSEQYELKLQHSLQELRDQYEAQMQANRDEIEFLQEQKVKNLQAAAARNANQAAAAVEELRTTRTRIDALNSRINELEENNAACNARIRELEQLLDRERMRYTADINNLETELQRLRDEMAHQLQEYQDLMDIKVSLDLEIAAYDKLLVGEESRLNITPVHNTANAFSQSLRSTRGTPARKTPSRAGGLSGAGSKRKRTLIEESEDVNQSEYFSTNNAKGDIQILEADPEGKFVKVHNKGQKEVQLGGWQLLRQAGNNETSFKFHRSVKIEPNAVVTVWSTDAGVTHEPPANIVMKTQKWFISDNMKTLLLNADGEEVAGSERIKRTITVHTSLHRGASRRRSISRVDGHEHSTVPKQGDEKCRLM